MTDPCLSRCTAGPVETRDESMVRFGQAVILYSIFIVSYDSLPEFHAWVHYLALLTATMLFQRE